ncbi:hypothetical protein [Citricoccus sp.]|uniref:hypothetical protein n=1 Tax=Citricoccus sp. TaxID=1978372 RepID=UPI002BA26635|nr:hypothetical protein [Citricoccus sp.]HRO95086.1 hypothetical protein [Citricoccus sp.]
MAATYPQVDSATGRILHEPTHELYQGVKSVNGQTPDTDGAVEIDTASWVEDPPGSGLYRIEA